MFLLFAFCLAATVSAHTLHDDHDPRELSDLYVEYQQSAKKCELKTRAIKPAHPKTDFSNIFFPPLPGQTSVDYHPQLRVLPTEDEPLTYYSWHIHVYFFQEDKNVTGRALSLREAFMKNFRVPKCTGSCFMGGPFDNCTQGICVWDPFFTVDGPHPYGQWGVYLPNENVAETLSWLSANHGEFPVLFHPNTGLMVGDHDPYRRAIWIRQQVPLDLDFLIWLQCKWFGCNPGVSHPAASL